MSDLLHVSAAPHKRSSITTRDIMKDVVIALVPTSLFGIYNFGIRALIVLMVAVLACVATEKLYCKYMKLPMTTDFSAVVTGLLLGLNLPHTLPLWMVVIGSAFAIVVVKMVFGGLGQNFMNPALAARAFLLISFPKQMIDFAVEKSAGTGVMDYIKNGASSMDGVTSATPLVTLGAGENLDLLKLFIGDRGGTIGETSAIAILIGAIYLLARKVITLRIPLTYILSFLVFIVLFGGYGLDANFIVGHILGGGLLIGAFFMATDYVTCPATPKGQIVFGIALGLLTGIFRIYGASAEGVSYAIIFCNLLVPLIEKVTRPKHFGKERVKRGK